MTSKQHRPITELQNLALANRKTVLRDNMTVALLPQTY